MIQRIRSNGHRRSIVLRLPRAAVLGIHFAEIHGNRRLVQITVGNVRSAWTGGNGIVTNATNARMASVFLVVAVVVSAANIIRLIMLSGGDMLQDVNWGFRFAMVYSNDHLFVSSLNEQLIEGASIGSGQQWMFVLDGDVYRVE